MTECSIAPYQMAIHRVNFNWDGRQYKDIEVPNWFDCTATQQYVGIWKIMVQMVLALQAKKVLEFGTSRGASTRIFAEALKQTGGHIWTVDIEDQPWVKEPIQDNITFIQSDVLKLDWKDSVDILYIDDLHEPFHVYEELQRFGHLARIVMLHDTIQDYGLPANIMPAIMRWASNHHVPITTYPLNPCGLTMLNVEQYKDFYVSNGYHYPGNGG